MTLQYDSSDEDFTAIFSNGASYKAVGDTDETGIDIFDSAVLTSGTSTFSAPSGS